MEKTKQNLQMFVKNKSELPRHALPVKERDKGKGEGGRENLHTQPHALTQSSSHGV